MMMDFWDNRYSQAAYAYGIAPNAYFKSIIDKLPPGKILIPGAGEGRDAVYAARMGWEVHAFDQSVEGKNKASRLSSNAGVYIDYDVLDVRDFHSQDHYDLVALVYFHLPPLLRKEFHRKVVSMLNPGGHVVLEAFNPNQIGNPSGGPTDVSLLMTSSGLREEFIGLHELENLELKTELNEGLYHVGPADIVRFHGQLL